MDTGNLLALSDNAMVWLVHVDAGAYITTIFPALKKLPVGIVESGGRVVGVIILKDVITAMTGANDFE